MSLHSPANIDAEKRIIAKALSVPAVFWPMSNNKGLTAEMFYVPSHQIVFEAMTSLLQNNLYPDLDLLSIRLREEFVDKKRGVTVYAWIGGEKYLCRLANTPYDVASYADDIKDVIDWHRLRREWARLDKRMK